MGIKLQFKGRTQSGELTFYLEGERPHKVVAKCGSEKEATETLIGPVGSLFKSGVLSWVAQLTPKSNPKSQKEVSYEV